MNDFAKIKIAFTVALLAALYTINPLILKIGGVGAIILGANISVKLIYYLMLGCLGVSVYFYSVQFISEKKIKYVQEAGDILYGIALSLPPAFLSLFVALKGIALIGKDELTSILNPLLGLIAGILSSFLSAKFKGKITAMRRASDAKGEEGLGQEYLSRAKQLFDDGYFDLSILETFKAIESALKRTLLFHGVEVEPGRFLANFRKAKQLEILNSTDLKAIDQLRKIRNKVAHKETEVEEPEARALLRDGEKILISLSSYSNPIISNTGLLSFDWLMENYNDSISVLSGGKTGSPSEILRKAVDAWNNRDGAIGSEISRFFAEALIYKPEILIDELKAVDDFDEWIDFMPRDILTDWRGNKEEELEELRKTIIESLQTYVEQEKNKKRLYIAEQILEGFKGSEIKKIY